MLLTGSHNPEVRFSHDVAHLSCSKNPEHIYHTSLHSFIFLNPYFYDPISIHCRYEGHTVDIDKALGSCDPSKPVILIAHRPQTAKLALESKHRVDLVLSGKDCAFLNFLYVLK